MPSKMLIIPTVELASSLLAWSAIAHAEDVSEYQFRVGPISTGEFIRACPEKQKLCDTVMGDLDGDLDQKRGKTYCPPWGTNVPDARNMEAALFDWASHHPDSGNNDASDTFEVALLSLYPCK